MKPPTLLEGHTPGSDEWLRCISASKVSAILGLSPWESRFALWHRMGGLAERQGDSDVKRRGHYLEPAVRNWFADQHPEFIVGGVGGTYANPYRPWQIATPDGQCWDLSDASEPPWPDAPTALLECKTDANTSYAWGAPGSDEVPVWYRAQAIWQMDVLQVPTCYVALLGDRLRFEEYVLHYDKDEAEFIRQECFAFLNSLPGGIAEERPDVDDHDQTYEVMRQLPAGLIDEAAEVDAALAIRYHQAVRGFKAAKSEQTLATSLVLDVIGEKHWAYMPDGRKVATRVVNKSDGTTKYLKPVDGFVIDASEEQ